MGGVLTCRVTATVTIGTALPVTLVVDVPETGTGLVDVTIPFPGIGDLVLVGIPCPTLGPITLTILGNTVTLSVVEVTV
ncbi:hypothetical protein [Priestia megaterium]|uniref:hypothetical protein n=1 Tax=Priestia megaterium TaxID=1404 RepID=UPI000BFA2732|nr:hypothetical protein [Priestia megaterium]MED3976354.1 hypothetical protein [Priestia megaterium]PFI91816.1 hypothetical protein COI84_21070 [Priestia megaterium]PGR14215.1 hypothetical protein COC62_06390 [Priestia megaterium]